MYLRKLSLPFGTIYIQIIFARFRASAAVQMRSVLFGKFTWPIMLFYYRRFGTTYWYQLQGSYSKRRLLGPQRWDR
jgi:hypothetical protein